MKPNQRLDLCVFFYQAFMIEREWEELRGKRKGKREAMVSVLHQIPVPSLFSQKKRG
jgi:hypothetical protein